MEFINQYTKKGQKTTEISDSSSSLNSELQEVDPKTKAALKGGVTSVARPTVNLSSDVSSFSLISSAKTNDFTNWSTPVHSLLDQPPATLPQRLTACGIVFCVLFGAWAWFGTVEQVGNARGKLIPKGQTYRVEPLELGKVSQVLVKEGDTVRAGQMLVKLDEDLAKKEIARLQEMLTAHHVELKQKQTLLEKVELEAQTHQLMARSEQQIQESALAQAKEKVSTIRQLLILQNSEVRAYRNRQAELRSLPTVAQERLKQLNLELESHQRRLEKLRPLQEEGAISQEYIFQAERELRNVEQQILQSQLQEINNVEEQVFQATQSLRDIESRITQNQGELANSLKEAEQLETELSLKQAEAQQTLLQYQQRKKQLEVEITQLQAKSAETKNLLVSAEAQLKHKYLIAPVDGTILSLNLQNTGQVVEPGKTVAEIAPEGVPLVLSAVLPNQEAGFVEEGMAVKVKLDAYPYQDYGVIPGIVSKISPDAKSDEHLGEIYQVEVTLDRDHVLENQQPISFKAGQTATADIIIRRRRIIDVLLEPIKKLQQDGMNL
jgi:HlyD family secretion protein